MVVTTKFAVESKVWNSTFWSKMPNVAVCHISVAWNINFKNDKMLVLL